METSSNYNDRIESVLRRTATGGIAMFARHALVLPIGMVANIVLARLIDPADFGTYAIAVFLITTCSFFSDIGLRPALIQQKTPPTISEMRTAFTLWAGLSTFLAICLSLLAPLFTRFYNLQPQDVWLIRGIALNLLLENFGGGSIVILQRNLEYGTLAKLEVFKTITQSILTVVLAFLGMKTWSLVIGLIAGSATKAIGAFLAAPWRIGFGKNASYVKKSARFGVYFQLGAITSLLRDNINSLFAGPVFGPTAVGYLKWAHDTSFFVSQAFTTVITSVMFPSIARLQDDLSTVGQMTEKVTRYLMLFTAPVLALVAAFASQIITIVYADKWIPAIPALYFFVVRMLGSNITTTYSNVLNGIGKASTCTKILVWWTAADWIFALALSRFIGFSGVAAGYALGVWLPVIWMIIELKRLVPLRIGYAFVRPLLIAAGIALAFHFVGKHWIGDLATLLVTIFCGFIAFAISMLIIERRIFWNDIILGFKIIGMLYRATKNQITAKVLSQMR